MGVLLGLVLCALGIWYLFRWLFSRTSREGRRHIPRQSVFLWAKRLWVSLASVLRRVVLFSKPYREAGHLYRSLLKWGHRSGLPHLVSETPAEYGSRLGKQFPSLTGEIGGIVEAFNLAVYGEAALDEARMTQANAFWKRLRSPRYWPARLKSWSIGSTV
jgi:hypothetical protein